MAQALDALNNLVREPMPQKQRKKSAGSRILSAIFKTKTTERHKAYQKYHREATERKRKPLSFGEWSGSRGMFSKTKPKKSRTISDTARTKDVTRRLKHAGIDQATIDRLRGRKKSK